MIRSREESADAACETLSLQRQIRDLTVVNVVNIHLHFIINDTGRLVVEN